MLNENMIRWMNASINKYFEDKRQNIKLYVEGEKVDMQKIPEWIELRITGPRYKEPSKDVFHFEIDINLLVNVKQNLQDTYRPHVLAGIFSKAMADVIPIKKFGDDVDIDDESLIGCLTLRNDVPRSIDVLQWGVIDTSTDVYQTSIDGFYHMET